MIFFTIIPRLARYLLEFNWRKIVRIAKICWKIRKKKRSQHRPNRSPKFRVALRQASSSQYTFVEAWPRVRALSTKRCRSGPDDRRRIKRVIAIPAITSARIHALLHAGSETGGKFYRRPTRSGAPIYLATTRKHLLTARALINQQTGPRGPGARLSFAHNLSPAKKAARPAPLEQPVRFDSRRFFIADYNAAKCVQSRAEQIRVNGRWMHNRIMTLLADYEERRVSLSKRPTLALICDLAYAFSSLPEKTHREKLSNA